MMLRTGSLMAYSTKVLLILASAGVCWASSAADGLTCLWSSQRNPEAAIRSCTAAIESGRLRQAGMAAAFGGRCRAYFYKHELQRALQDCEHAVQLNPKAASLVYNRATIRYHSGDIDGAMLDFAQASRMDPDLSLAYAGLASVHVKRNQFDLAIEDYSAALRINPAAWIYYGRGWTYANKQEYDAAIADLGEAIRLGSGAEGYYWRGRCYAEKGDYGRALRDFDQAIRLQPNAAWYYGSRASAHAWRHEFDEVIRDYDQMLRLAPDADAYYGRGWAYYQKGSYILAVRDFIHASWLKPALLGRWVWTPLVPAAWLIWFVLRRRQSKQAAANREQRADQPLVPR